MEQVYRTIIICFTFISVPLFCSCEKNRIETKQIVQEEYLPGFLKSELLRMCSESTIKDKTVALLGGSYAMIDASKVVIDSWKDIMNVHIVNYAKSGFGFCPNPYSGPDSIYSEAISAAGKYNYYVIWASTNDIYYGIPVGGYEDYSLIDNYSEDNSRTQCGGINKVLKTLLDANPHAEIWFISSLPFFRFPLAYDMSINKQGSIGSYVNGQKLCCQKYNVHFLNMLELKAFTVDNYTHYFENDDIHLNREGYKLIATDILFFLADS